MKEKHAAQNTPKRILIVDDEADILESVKILVENMGHTVVTATRGKEALRLLQKEKFDLVLLDIIMPEMSGQSVLEHIRKNAKLKNQKVALLTVIQLSQTGQESMRKLNPAEYFQKPIDIVDFKRRLNRIL